MSNNKRKCTAIILAAGSGSRMKSDVAKQYMLLDGKPLIWYALHAAEVSDIIDECILVTGAEDISYVRREIVEKYEFHKVKKIVAGGAERYLSVSNALQAMEEGRMPMDGYVFIHDGARPFLTEEILRNTYSAVQQYRACVAAVPSKDTVKIADKNTFAAETPDRRKVWNIQTPQVFEAKLIQKAYAKLQECHADLQSRGIAVTDDAGVVELFTEQKIKLVEASYRNIKITTPEDIEIAEAFLKFEKFQKFM